MFTIEGVTKQKGVATAIAAVVNVNRGLDGVSPALLQEGIRAIKMGLTRKDYPEAVIACDNLETGLGVRIPGVNIIAIASESYEDNVNQQIDIPCVIGLPNLLESIYEDNIIIVDGDRGVVHIDPDPETIVYYQQMEEQKVSAQRIFISSEHISAKTQAGDIVYAYAYISDESEISRAIENGADGLIADLRDFMGDPTQYCESILRIAAGMPVFFIVDLYAEEVLRTAMWLAISGQVTLAFSTPSFDDHVNELQPMLMAMDNDPNSTSVNVGTLLDSEAQVEDIKAYPLLIDLRESSIHSEQDANALQQQVKHWAGDMHDELLVLILGKKIDAIEHFVNAGARCVGVSPNLIGEAKYAIRSIGLEDVD